MWKDWRVSLQYFENILGFPNERHEHTMISIQDPCGNTRHFTSTALELLIASTKACKQTRFFLHKSYKKIHRNFIRTIGQTLGIYMKYLMGCKLSLDACKTPGLSLQKHVTKLRL